MTTYRENTMYATTRLINGYATLAWADGDKKLQAARWQYIKQRLADLETVPHLGAEGITAAVLSELKTRRERE